MRFSYLYVDYSFSFENLNELKTESVFAHLYNSNNSPFAQYDLHSDSFDLRIVSETTESSTPGSVFIKLILSKESISKFTLTYTKGSSSFSDTKSNRNPTIYKKAYPQKIIENQKRTKTISKIRDRFLHFFFNDLKRSL